MAGGRDAHLHDLPEKILSKVFELVEERTGVRATAWRWCATGGATSSTPAALPSASTATSVTSSSPPRTFCFPSLTHLDLSHISTWGHPFLHHRNPIIDDHQHLIAFLLRRAFPNVSSLAFYALQALAPLWPALRHAKLVRWHQRHSHHPHGADLAVLLAACPSLAHLDISHFYCWAEDVPEALHAFSAAAASLTRLNLLSAAVLGFGASELFRIFASCPNLRHLLALCVFDPRYIDFVGDDALLAVATNCPGLSLLHLADPSAVSPAAHPQPDAKGFAPHDARITAAGLEALFGALPVLEELALDLCHNVRDAGPALEALSQRCPKMKSLKLGGEGGFVPWRTCVPGRGAALAVCGRLEFLCLCIHNSADVTDAS